MLHAYLFSAYLHNLKIALRKLWISQSKLVYVMETEGFILKLMGITLGLALKM